MKILFVAVFSKGSTNISQYECLEKIGHEVIKYDYRSPDSTNQKIIKSCKDGNVDLTIFSKCNGLDISVIQECNQHSITCLWYMDTMVSWNYELEQKIKECSFTACAWKGPYEKASEISNKVFLIDEGFDPKLDYPVNIKKTIDVSFIGSLDNKRSSMLNSVSGLSINNVYGNTHARMVGKTKINLNFTRDGGSSDRVYKILAAKGFLLTEEYYGREEKFVDNRDLVIFKNVDDLKEKVKYYLANDEARDLISTNGYVTVQNYSRLSWAKNIIRGYYDSIS